MPVYERNLFYTVGSGVQEWLLRFWPGSSTPSPPPLLLSAHRVAHGHALQVRRHLDAAAVGHAHVADLRVLGSFCGVVLWGRFVGSFNLVG